jgi:HSP20 family protein
MLPSLWRRKGQEPLLGLRSEIDRLFEDLFEDGASTRGGLPARLEREMIPALDLRETDDALILEAELPGVRPEDLDVHVTDGALVLRGERRQDKDEKTRAWHRIERSYGRFERAFQLPGNVDPEKTEAIFKEGVLTVTVPKVPEAKGRTVTVKVESVPQGERHPVRREKGSEEMGTEGTT